MGDVGLAVQRAEDKTAQMQARAGAIDELLASGALDDATGTTKDDITLELEQLASTSDVENELAAMRASLGTGRPATTPAIEGQAAPTQAPPPPAAGRQAFEANPQTQSEPQTQSDQGDPR